MKVEFCDLEGNWECVAPVVDYVKAEYLEGWSVVDAWWAEEEGFARDFLDIARLLNFIGIEELITIKFIK
jgi:hypothetical protein